MEANAYIQDWFDKKKQVQEYILDFLKNENNEETFLQNYPDQSILENKNELTCLFHLISSISANHHSSIGFIAKIEQIICHFKDQIRNLFSNFDIFNLFKKNKRILLYLFKEKIIIPDSSIAIIISRGKYQSRNYPEYFQQEFKNFIQTTIIEKDIEAFERKRMNGENDNFVCQMIRNDQIEDFVKYANQTNLKLSSQINKSIFETNSFLVDKSPTLIEYSAFFGSIQIFKYLQMNNVQLTPSLWLYAIHGNNPDLIHLLEENRIECKDQNYLKCYKESIKCHHINIMYYLKDNFIQINDEKQKQKIFSYDLQYYNLIDFVDNNFIIDDKNFFYYLCKYNYVCIVDYILKNIKIDLNASVELKKHNQISKKTPLFIAAEKGNSEIVQLLILQNNTNVNEISTISTLSETEITRIDAKTSFHIAVEKSNPTIFQLLLSREDLRVNEKEKTSFTKSNFYYIKYKTITNLAIKIGNPEILQLLIQQRKLDINDKSYYQIEYNKNEFNYSGKISEQSTLHAAVEEGNFEIIQILLLNQNINVNDKSIISEIPEPQMNLQNVQLNNGINRKSIFLIEKNTGICSNCYFCSENNGRIDETCCFCLNNSGKIKNCFHCSSNSGVIKNSFMCQQNCGMINNIFSCSENTGKIENCNYCEFNSGLITKCYSCHKNSGICNKKSIINKGCDTHILFIYLSYFITHFNYIFIYCISHQIFILVL